MYDFSQGTFGAVVQPDPGKVRITIQLDEDVIEGFRKQVNAAGGGNYQTLINKALREYIGARAEPLEETLRRVIREELRKRALLNTDPQELTTMSCGRGSPQRYAAMTKLRR